LVLDLIKTADGFIQSLAEAFPKPHDPRVAKGAFAIRVLELRSLGGLHISSNTARAPDGNGDSITTVIGRLNVLAENLYEETKDLSADVRADVLRRRDSEVINHALHQLAGLLRSKIPRYEQKLQEVVGSQR
jgi:hypothetical protein